MERGTAGFSVSDKIIVLLGRRDYPTDAVEDYCRFLSQSLAIRGYVLDLLNIPWLESGWVPSLRWLWHKSQGWKRHWILVQYTALGWSRHGFPPLVLAVLGLLRIRGVRIAVVFHDPEPYSGERLVDRARRVCQRCVMRCSYWMTNRSVLTVPLEDISWLPAESPKAIFIPVGANIPAVVTPVRTARNGCEVKTIAVFGLTAGGSVGSEVSDIAFVAKSAAKCMSEIRLVTLGRGSEESESKFRRALEGTSVEYRALGILSAEDASEILANSDVALFVRGPISTQRGSAIASIACGLPLVAYSDSLPTTFAEAGVVGVPLGDRERLAEATIRILTDRQLWLELHHGNQRAYAKYFSWETIAARFLELLDHA